MTYKIISPTGNFVMKTLTDDEAQSLKAGKYFTVISMQPRVFVGGSTCVSCEG